MVFAETRPGKDEGFGTDAGERIGGAAGGPLRGPEGGHATCVVASDAVLSSPSGGGAPGIVRGRGDDGAPGIARACGDDGAPGIVRACGDDGVPVRTTTGAESAGAALGSEGGPSMLGSASLGADSIGG